MTLVIGKIVKAQGIKGEVKIVPITDDAMRFNSLKKAFIDGREYSVEYARVDGADKVILKLDGVNTRNEAELFQNKFLSVAREDAAPLEQGAYYIVDLLGCAVYVGDKPLGTLVDILQNSKVDVYAVSDGKKQILFPALKDLLVSVDVENKKIVLDVKRFGEVAVVD